MVSATTIASVLVLAAGVCLLALHLNNEEHEAQELNRVATPKIGMSQQNGPWPKCLGMDGDECCSMIEGKAEDIKGNCFVLGEDSMVTMDFNTKRVRVFVDSDNVVTKIPSRG